MFNEKLFSKKRSLFLCLFWEIIWKLGFLFVSLPKINADIYFVYPKTIVMLLT